MVENSNLEFDFVIVGGGTAGLVVASRLCEDPDVSVVVIEAGYDATSESRVRVPGQWFNLIGSDLDWNYMSTSQPGLNDRKIGQPQGRVLGGSSAVNGQCFIPPSASVVNAWGQLGNPGWTWETLAPYFRKAYTLTLPSDADHRSHLGLDYLDRTSHGTSGPLHVSYRTPTTEPLAAVWATAFQELGYAATADPFSGVATGGFNSAATIDSEFMERSYSASAHWNGARKTRTNLHLLSKTVAERIVFETRDGDEAAVAVDVVMNEGKQRVQARREIILAAGAFGSPKLLELSGIGDPELLAKHKIETRVALPAVGENMQDHLMTGISFEVDDGVQTLDSLRRKDPDATAAAVEAFEQRKEGPLTLGGINYFSYMPIVVPSDGRSHYKVADDPGESIASDADLPFANELAAHPHALDTGDNTGLKLQYEFLQSVVQSHDEGSGGVYLSPRGTTYGASARAQDYSISTLSGNYITIGLSLLQPFSRGQSHISSADPIAEPCIDPHYLSNPLDVEVAAAHLAFIERLADTSAFAQVLKQGGRRNATEATGRDRERARQWTRRSVLSNWHQCGTCSMMPREHGGVVDARLKVHGTKRLRVVDSSVMPIIPRGNIQSSVYMVAERAADLIKQDHGLKLD